MTLQRSISVLQVRDGPIPKNQLLAAYFYVDDIKVLRADLTQNRLDVSSLSTNNADGCDDFDVIDPIGQRLAFGQDKNPDLMGPGM